MKDPETPAEWQDAVNAAEAALLLDSARLYGLVTGGPHVNVARCEVILARGKQRGVVPVEAGVDAHIHAIIAEGRTEVSHAVEARHEEQTI
jgi:hypothetical protein